MGGHNAWITHEQTSIDAMAMAEMREVRVRKTTLVSSDETLTRARFRRVRARCFIFVRRFGDATSTSDPHPPDSRAPPSAFTSPTASFGAEYGAS